MQPDIVLRERAHLRRRGSSDWWRRETRRTGSRRIAGEERRHIGERQRRRGVRIVDDIELRALDVETEPHRVPPLDPIQVASTPSPCSGRNRYWRNCRWARCSALFSASGRKWIRLMPGNGVKLKALIPSDRRGERLRRSRIVVLPIDSHLLIPRQRGRENRGVVQRPGLRPRAARLREAQRAAAAEWGLHRIALVDILLRRCGRGCSPRSRVSKIPWFATKLEGACRIDVVAQGSRCSRIRNLRRRESGSCCRSWLGTISARPDRSGWRVTFLPKSAAQHVGQALSAAVVGEVKRHGQSLRPVQGVAILNALISREEKQPVLPDGRAQGHAVPVVMQGRNLILRRNRGAGIAEEFRRIENRCSESIRSPARGSHWCPTAW